MIELILGIGFLFALVYAIATHGKMRQVLLKQKEALALKDTDMDKLASLRQEMGQLKQELAKKNQLLADSKEQLKKKQKKEEQKQEEQGMSQAEVLMDENTEVAKLKQTLKAMETQLNTYQSEREQVEQSVRKKLENQYETELKSLRNEVRNMAEGQQRKVKMTTVLENIEQLPPEVVSELARLARKAEHHEKLHALTKGKFQMSQERFLELQKRYFAVCRELALISGQAPEDDHKAVSISETIIDETESN